MVSSDTSDGQSDKLSSESSALLFGDALAVALPSEGGSGAIGGGEGVGDCMILKLLCVVGIRENFFETYILT